MMEKCYDEGTLQAFLDNELAPELSQSIARHLALCDPCAILLAEVEEETAFAFNALEQEFNTLVPTQRLWTKINDSIEIQSRNRSFWQKLLSFASGLSLLNPQVVAFGSLLLIVGVVSALIVVKQEDKGVASVPPVVQQTAPNKTIPQVVNLPIETTPPDVVVAKETKSRPPQTEVQQAVNAERNERIPEKGPSRNDDFSPQPVVIRTPKYLDGEENYVTTIARLEKTVDGNKDEVLKPAARFSYEKNLAVVNDTISKLKKEVRKNPKNEDAKQILFTSYQNKIELLNSVTQQGELMASLR